MGSALQRLKEGGVVLGVLQTLNEPALAEAAGWSGFDFVILDSEHGLVDEAQQLAALRAVASTDAFALVRVRPGDPTAVSRYFDFGADGVVVPDVRTAAEARALALGALSPSGRRSRLGSLSRADRYGLGHEIGQTRPDPLLIVMIESGEGAANVEAILDVEGVDGLIIGPRDLAADLGVPGAYETDAYRSAVARIEQAARARDKILGTTPHGGASLSQIVERGNRLIMVAADIVLLRDALVAALAAARRDAGPA